MNRWPWPLMGFLCISFSVTDCSLTKCATGLNMQELPLTGIASGAITGTMQLTKMLCLKGMRSINITDSDGFCRNEGIDRHTLSNMYVCRAA